MKLHFLDYLLKKYLHVIKSRKSKLQNIHIQTYQKVGQSIASLFSLNALTIDKFKGSDSCLATMETILYDKQFFWEKLFGAIQILHNTFLGLSRPTHPAPQMWHFILYN